ncbi:4-hydroxy-tetrahydrodipicolinate synthase [Pelagibacterium xiamenense]|uniref:4-hydroxy-tetrahydrodipicolinate synthase n=1 Tax=Pelagibacterium xiamenense TaxID=2901140 RepID=UPI001E38CBF8|nr:4-hydroxy-tetrahydrodipicolinate synthase [Pelagibacterium xiamenense]MCD7060765.1 4-hydroxy-tetrahydrodipicolinate synthase [Pelagibacterium xiamenense]
MFSGSITALITPFNNGAVDEDAMARFVKWQIEEGSHGVVPVGTTGESPTVSHEEHRRLIEITIEVADKQIPVIAGAGSNSTREAIHLAEFAEKAGADGILTILPYYNKPNQEGLFQHFSAIAKATSLPVVIYSVPPRTVIDISVETLKRLRDAHPNIVGIKDATADMGKATMQRHVLGPDFILLSGEDMTALGFNAHGGRGCISVTSNVAPRLCADFQNACQAGDYATALTLQDRLAPLHKALFIEPNPAGVKYAAARLGLIKEDLRLPLVPVSETTRQAIDDALVHAGLMN